MKKKHVFFLECQPGTFAEVADLTDELRINDIEWRQAYLQLFEKMKTMEQNNKTMEKILQREIDSITMLVLVEIISAIESKDECHVKHYMEHSPGEQKTKKRRLI